MDLPCRCPLLIIREIRSPPFPRLQPCASDGWDGCQPDLRCQLPSTRGALRCQGAPAALCSDSSVLLLQPPARLAAQRHVGGNMYPYCFGPMRLAFYARVRGDKIHRAVGNKGLRLGMRRGERQVGGNTAESRFKSFAQILRRPFSNIGRIEMASFHLISIEETRRQTKGCGCFFRTPQSR
jgi:hypothetical protein